MGKDEDDEKIFYSQPHPFNRTKSQLKKDLI